MFRRLGPGTTPEWLDRPLNHPGAALRFRLRCGGAPLMELVGEEADDQVCRMCDSGDTEDAEHFACHCAKYEAERQDCLSRVLKLLGDIPAPKLREAIAYRDTALFLGDAQLGELS